MRVVICGGGVVGASIAYFLSCLGARPIQLAGRRYRWIVAWGRQTPPHRFIQPNLPLP